MLGLAVLIFVSLWLSGLELGLTVALALGVPSFIYAAIQFDVGNGTVHRLIDLQHQLSTRRLDEAPFFLSNIAELLGKAEKEILIFCDFPAYGALSNPDDYKDYFEAICRQVQADKPSVKILCLDESTRQKLAAESYRESESAKRKAGYRTEAQYLEAAKKENSEAEVAFARLTRHTSLVMPLYFWVADGKAIFSLRRYAGERMTEVGFATSDKPLIDALRGIFDRYVEVDQRYCLVKKSDEGITDRTESVASA